jgi:hypothetical protein
MLGLGLSPLYTGRQVDARPQHFSSCFCISFLHQFLHTLKEMELVFKCSCFWSMGVGTGKWRWKVGANDLNTLINIEQVCMAFRIRWHHYLGVLDKLLYRSSPLTFFCYQPKRWYILAPSYYECCKNVWKCIKNPKMVPGSQQTLDKCSLFIR